MPVTQGFTPTSKLSKLNYKITIVNCVDMELIQILDKIILEFNLKVKLNLMFFKYC